MTAKITISFVLLALLVAASMQMPDYEGKSRVKREDEEEETIEVEEDKKKTEEPDREAPNKETPSSGGAGSEGSEGSGGGGFGGFGGFFPTKEELFNAFVKPHSIFVKPLKPFLEKWINNDSKS